MAYDPNDPKDVAIVAAAVADAVAEKEAEFETETAGLRATRDRLIKEKKALQKNGGEAVDTTELEATIERLTGELKVATKAADKATKEATAAAQTATTERTFAEGLLKETALTDALTGVNVAGQFLPAVKSLLAGQVAIKEVDGERRAFVGDKSVSDFVKEWSQGDQGKHYVTAPKNSGGGSEGGGAADPTKIKTRAAFDGMDSAERMAFSKDGGKVID